MALLTWAFLMVALILLAMGRSAKKSSNRLEEWYDTKWNPDFCVIPGHDNRCFTYTIYSINGFFLKKYLNEN